MRFSSFMVAILIVSLGAVSFATFYANIATQYGVDYDNQTNATIAVYNNLAEISTVTSNINNTLFGTSTGTDGGINLVGTFLGAGFNVLKLARASFDSFYTIAENAIISAGVPPIFLDVILVTVLVIILFIIVSALIGKDV